MRSTFGVMLLTSLVLSSPLSAQVKKTEDIQRVPIAGELVVCFETEADRLDLDAAVAGWAPDLDGGLVVESAELLLQWTPPGKQRQRNVVLLRLPDGEDSDGLIGPLGALDAIEWSAPNYRYLGDPRELVPNDTQYGSQYHHPLMQNDLAWDITLGDPGIIVAVTDDGIDLDHVDLVANIWVNRGEIAGNGIDDEGNGFIDDVNGWDFAHDNNNPNPDSSFDDHGTHVAGIAGARTNNGVGVAGTAGATTIMPIQWYDGGNSSLWTSTVIANSFAYAVDNGARIISTSYNINLWVGDPTVIAGFQYLYDQGGLHFNSAGNGSDLNPPRQAFHQTFLVASTDAGDVKASSSNYGTGIDLAAPGSSVLSTVLNNNYGTKSGTSMAAPNAAGAAALVWAANPTWTRDQVVAKLLAACDDIDAQNPSFAGLLGAGRVNSFRALTEPLDPPTVSQATGLPPDGGYGPIPDDTFSLRFDKVMDPAAVNDPNAFTMTFSGANGVFGNGDDAEVPITRNEYLVATNEIVFEIGGGGAMHGRYRVRADAPILANPFGTPLDGNGDGTPGDSWERTFWFLSTCVADLTGDDVVDFADLLLLLSGWSNAGPGDIDTSGIVDLQDLLLMLSQWGSCGTGACCLPTGCEVLSAQDCAAQGGVYTSLDEACADGCPVGACCLEIGCAQLSEQECIAQGGTYSGAGVGCGNAGCGAPSNDLCADALAVEDGDYLFSTFEADTDGPAHASCEFDGQTYNDIWYTYVAPASGLLTVSLCDQADYDTDLVIYDGCVCGSFVLLGCDDDTSGCGGFTSELTVNVVQGNCYLIRVGGYVASSSGSGTMTVDGPDAP